MTLNITKHSGGNGYYVYVDGRFLSINGTFITSEGSMSKEWKGFFHSLRETIGLIKRLYDVKKTIKKNDLYIVMQMEVVSKKPLSSYSGI